MHQHIEPHATHEDHVYISPEDVQQPAYSLHETVTSSTIEQIPITSSPHLSYNASLSPGPYQHEARPFTTKIDQIIHQEKERTGTTCIPGPRYTVNDGLFGVGPLDNPVFSSTARSGLATSQTDAVVHISRTKSGDFEPLRPDTGSTLKSSSHSNHDYKSPQMHQGLQTAISNPTTSASVGFENPVAAAFHEKMNDSQFLHYYQQLDPEERKQQLLVQKEALIQEQLRLRQILEEQEALLHSKQEQLHLQQAIQRNRLQYFEQTGKFPPSAMFNPTHGDLVSYTAGRNGAYDGMVLPPPAQARHGFPVEQGLHMHAERTNSALVNDPAAEDYVRDERAVSRLRGDPYFEKWPERPDTPPPQDDVGEYI